MDDLEILRAKEMIGALSQQRNQTADMVVQLVGENAVLQSKNDQLRKLADDTLKAAQDLCRAYDNAILSSADGCPEKDPEVKRLRALLGVKDE